MIWLVLVGGLVVAAIVAGFAYLIVGWAGAAFVAIATIGTIAVAWYGYVLYGKASDVAHEGAVVGKRLQAIGELLAGITIPERSVPDPADDHTPDERTTDKSTTDKSTTDKPTTMRHARVAD